MNARPHPRPTGLVVEDDPVAAEFYRLHLEARGFEVVVAGEWRAALEVASAQVLDLVLVDLGLPEHGGPWVARSVARRQAEPPMVIVVSARSRAEIDAAVVQLGALGGVSKGDPKGVLDRLLDRALEVRSGRRPQPSNPGGSRPPRAEVTARQQRH